VGRYVSGASVWLALLRVSADIRHTAFQGPTMHGLAVTREVAKQVYVAEKLAPPAPSEFAPAWRDIYEKASSHSWWEKTLTDGSWVTIAVIALEACVFHDISPFSRTLIYGPQTSCLRLVKWLDVDTSRAVRVSKPSTLSRDKIDIAQTN
jgi:hypothetical protein